MKNLLLFLFIAFLLPQVADCQYYFSVNIDEDNPCCIYIEAGTSGEVNDWTVVIDGSTTYDNDSKGEKDIYFCFDGNGSHTINFYVAGRLYWSRTIEIKDCDGSCTVCDIKTIKPSAYQLDGCSFFMDVDWLNVNGMGVYSPECTNPTYTWDYGDGTGYGPSNTPYDFHDYPGDGTYTACASFYVINPDGDTCRVSKCIEVVVEGCTEVEPCCGMELGELSSYQHPLNPCILRIIPSYYRQSSECGAVTYSWEVNGNPVAGSNSSLIYEFNGSGPYVVCLTMTQGTCVLKECITLNLPGCMGFAPNGDELGLERSTISEEEFLKTTSIKVYPNPAKDFINVAIIQNDKNPVEVISILDTTGKIITAKPAGTDTQISMDVSALPLGVYFIQVLNKEGQRTIERFVKMH